MTTPSPSPPISLSPPSAGGRLARCTAPPAHSPPLPPLSGCLTQIQTLRIAFNQALPLIWRRYTALPHLHYHHFHHPYYIPPTCSRHEIGESSTARPTRGRGIDYGFVSTVDAEGRRQGIRDVGYGYSGMLAPMSGRVDLLMGDRMTLQETVWMVEEEAYASREAWAHSDRLRSGTHQGLQTHRDHVYAHETYLQAHQTQLQLQSTLIQTQHQVHETRFQMQQAELAALRETDRRRQDQMVETLRVIRDMRREMSDMQAELLALREQQRRARQPGPEARIPDHQEASRDADSHI
ncbi:hypothetical protein Tco_0060659 [Tanacetum coccineum]